MATAFCANSSTFFSSASGSPGESAPASAGVLGAGGQGAVPPPRRAWTPHPAPCTPSPSSCRSPWPPLTCSRCQEGRAGEQEHDRRLHAWGESSARGGGGTRAPDPVPSRSPPGASPLTCTGLCCAGAAPGLPLYTLPRAPPGVFGQRSGAPGLAGGERSHRQHRAEGLAGSWETCGPRSQPLGACPCVRTRMCPCVRTRVCGRLCEPPLQGTPSRAAPGTGLGQEGDIQQPPARCHGAGSAQGTARLSRLGVCAPAVGLCEGSLDLGTAGAQLIPAAARRALCPSRDTPALLCSPQPVWGAEPGAALLPKARCPRPGLPAPAKGTAAPCACNVPQPRAPSRPLWQEPALGGSDASCVPRIRHSTLSPCPAPSRIAGTSGVITASHGGWSWELPPTPRSGSAQGARVSPSPSPAGSWQGCG